MVPFWTIETARGNGLFGPPVANQDLLLLTLAWLLASLPWVLGDHFIPYDSVGEFYPQSRFVVDSIRHGDWPWWNPYQYSGLPVLGDPQNMLFTLHTLVGTLLGPGYTLQAFDLVTLVHPFIGGLAIYAIGSSRGVPRVWLLSAALVFMLGGVATSRLQHVPQIIAYGLLPVLLWLLLMLESKPAIGRAMLLGLSGAIWAANANQVVFLGGLLLAVFAVLTVARSENRLRLAAMYGVAASVSLALLAPVYSAIIEIIALSTRSDFTLTDSAHPSFSPIVFASLFFPALFGNLNGKIWSVTDITQDFLYIGIIPISLYLLAFFSCMRWRTTAVLTWLTLLLFFVLFSLGVKTPLYPFLFNHIPGFDFFRRPVDAAYLLNLLFALGLLVIGRETARSTALPCGDTGHQLSASSRHLLFAIALSIPLLAFVLGAAAQSKDALPVLLENYGWLVVRVGLFAILLWWIKKQLTSPNRSFWILIVAGIFFAVDLGAAGRYSGLFSQRYSKIALARAYQHTQPPESNSLDAWLQSNTAPWARVEIIGGGESMGHSSVARWYNTQGYNPIQLRRYAEQIGSFVTFNEPRTFVDGSEGPLDQRFDVLGLRYVAFMTKWAQASEKDPSPASEQARRYRDELASGGARKLFSDDRYEVWERPGASRWLAVSDSASIDGLESAPCEVEEFCNTRLTIKCRSPVETTLVIGEVYAPGWFACVNGTPTPIEPFADLFRAVTLPAGPSTISMTYHPVPFLRHFGCSNGLFIARPDLPLSGE
ncbi:Protein of unknown function, membrane YfhO [Thiocapsa marina 5811]|uniref:YfhO family protein n=2 Tax=Thiocapsa marina TaxID=244573 RepID=F9UE12_9GAMM|nr:Protein of unknown function, membrane YfhO [Thiocapsa marina 5811]